jgi:hypothetical protein
VSGFSNFNEVTVHNNALLSSLNASGFTILNNNTTLLSSLNVSGFTILNNSTSLLSLLNVRGITNLNDNTTINGSLHLSGLNVLEPLNTHGTGLSALYNFRSDNPNAPITEGATT